MGHFEKFDKQLISSYESTLAAEREEICKEVDSLFKDNNEFLIEKAKFCLRFYFKKNLLIKICLINLKILKIIFLITKLLNFFL